MKTCFTFVKYDSIQEEPPTEADLIFPCFLLISANCVFAYFCCIHHLVGDTLVVFDALKTRSN